MQKQDRPVAFFDSGLGGISVLRETVRLLPQENYLYYGDSLHAPYGVKSEAQIQALSLAAAEHLVSAGAKAIVVACNTATSAAIGLLRQVYPDLPVIGTEPALKPAVEKYPGGIHFTEDGEHWVDVPADTTVSMNLWGYTPGFLKELEARFPAFLDKALVENPIKGEFFLPLAVSQLIAEKKATVTVLTSPDKWYGVTYAADKPAVVAALRRMTDEGKYPDGLWK